MRFMPSFAKAYWRALCQQAAAGNPTPWLTVIRSSSQVLCTRRLDTWREGLRVYKVPLTAHTGICASRGQDWQGRAGRHRRDTVLRA